jgi:hypothetical protein
VKKERQNEQKEETKWTRRIYKKDIIKVN